MRLPILISVCLSLTATSLCGYGAEVSDNRDLPPLRLAAADLDTILHKTHSVIAAANSPSGGQEVIRKSVKLGVPGKEIEIPHFSMASSVAFLKEVFGFPTPITDRISQSHPSDLISAITHVGCRSPAKPRIRSRQ